MSTTVCSFCAIFAADHTENFRARLTSDGNYFSEFKVPYHRTDAWPSLPNLTKSAEAGCALCTAIRDGLQVKHREAEERAEKKQPDRNRVHPWIQRVQQKWTKWYDHKVKLYGYFTFAGIHALPTASVAPALEIAVEARSRWSSLIHYRIYFRVFSIGNGTCSLLRLGGIPWLTEQYGRPSQSSSYWIAVCRTCLFAKHQPHSKMAHRLRAETSNLQAISQDYFLALPSHLHQFRRCPTH
jgi:hypothetical protein